MLKKEEIHFWDDIAYYHVPFTHCPSDEKKRLDLRCSCQPKDNFDWKDYSCMSIPPTDLYLSYKTNCDTGTKHWFDITKTEKPNGWDTKYDWFTHLVHGPSGSVQGWPSLFLIGDNARVGCLVWIRSAAHFWRLTVSPICAATTKPSVESGALFPLLYLWWVSHLDDAICYWFYHAWAKGCTFIFQLFHFDSRYRVTFKRFYFDVWHVLLLIFERSSLFGVCFVAWVRSKVIFPEPFSILLKFQRYQHSWLLKSLNIERDDMIINSRNP